MIDFAIVGAPKSATTSLQRYLRDHPQLFLPRRAEAHFFSDDVPIKGRIDSEEAYRALFSGSQAGQKLGEKSVFYLFSEVAAENISAMAPTAKILIMLRQPADMLFSLHRQFMYTGNELLADFKEALAAEPMRRAGTDLPLGAHNPRALAYRRVAEYAPQVERYLRLFGDHQVHICLFDDFVKNTATEYERILRFLGVNSTHRPAFEVHNPAKRVPSISLRHWIRLCPPLRHAAARVVPRRARLAVRSATSMVQRQPPARLDRDLRRELTEEFTPGITALSTLIGRDLSHWLA